MLLFLNIIYVLLAVAMIALILMQRGAGAQAGSGFGGGASGTVFGARGSANFLSKSTKWLAVVFFVLSLLISWEVSRSARKPDADTGGSIMAQVPNAPASNGGAIPNAPTGAVPAAPSAIPAAPAPVQSAPASTTPAQPASAPATTPPNTTSPAG
ncbi:preprotein translocase subunit SecG [Lysobacter sp. TY2-98]|uniref:preprotein translocase subunit SecG n=1 Tax=Lysobacter sp. TY2-98 TaxID=2290922 RepID=UPI000E208F95|nr:preprotein translocase subunit SecG [Lysobacter sp. TY2-98]AXK71917.1 preprotein translocase subunit SecG [Lysobacter sp. TY2-98]